MPAMLAWAKANPGRLTHPTVSNFLGATFLKQALYELTPDAALLQQPATDSNFAAATAPLANADFFPEEAPEATNAVLQQFLAGRI